MDDCYGLQRFVDAQRPVYDTVLRELGAGAKRTHWMWFIFPQLAGLGSSPTAVHFALSSLAEAMAYLQHPLLGDRLLHCTGLVNRVEGRTARSVFGTPDDLKFRSSMTLFSMAAPDVAEFRAALDRYFDGVADERTVALLQP